MGAGKNANRKDDKQPIKKESLHLHVMGKSDFADSGRDWFWIIGGGIIIICLIFILFSLI